MLNAIATPAASATYAHDPLTAAVDLLAMVADFLRDGVAGTDAAEHIGTRDTDPVDALTLLRELGAGDLTEGARLARLLDAVAANLSVIA